MPWRLDTGFDSADGVTPIPLQPAGVSGTPLPVGTQDPLAGVSISANGSGVDPVTGEKIPIEQPPGSIVIERAEQCTSQHKQRTLWESCLNFLSVIGRGVFTQDSYGNIFRVLSSQATKMAGGIGEISVVSESISFDSPPDDYSIEPVELGLDILKHPRYSWCLNPNPADNTTYATVGAVNVPLTEVKESIVRMIQSYRDAPFYPSAAFINGLIQSNVLSQIKGSNGQTYIAVQWPNPVYQFVGGAAPTDPVQWLGTVADAANLPSTCQYVILNVPVNLGDPNDPVAISLAAAKEVIYKLWRQEDTPYLVGFELTWVQYFFEPTYLNPGGYIEDPSGIVPEYFLSPVESGLARASLGTNSNNDTSPPVSGGAPTIFDQIALINPQCYSQTGLPSGTPSFSCLRKADLVSYQRTWFAVSHKWLIAPTGRWDINLYSSGPRPQNANDFNQNP